MQFGSFWFLTVLSAALTFGIRQLALHFKVTPKNDYRRQHQGAIALWGGLGIYLTLVTDYFIEPKMQLLNLILGSLPLILIGLQDDRKELKAAAKFIAQCFAAVLWLYLSKENNLLIESGWPSYLAYPISVLWIVGLCNAFNLIDGTDGQCSIVAFMGLVILSLSFPELSPVTMPVAGAILGFMLWNYPPAKIYLGESGSTLLGFCLATQTLNLPAGKSAVPMILGALFLAAFPLTDTVLAIARRKLKKRPIFSGDKDHIHHVLHKLGFDKSKTLLIVAIMVIGGDLTAFNLFRTENLTSSLVLALNTACLMNFGLFGIYYTKKMVAQKISYFGKSILEQHLEGVNADPIDLNCRKAYLIDLLHYYAELQSRGMPTIIQFVKEISTQLKDPKFSHYSVGSYSIAVVCRNGNSWSEAERQTVNQRLKEIFSHFGVLKSLSETPEGIYYFDQSNIQSLLDTIHTAHKDISVAPLSIAS